MKEPALSAGLLEVHPSRRHFPTHGPLSLHVFLGRALRALNPTGIPETWFTWERDRTVRVSWGDGADEAGILWAPPC